MNFIILLLIIQYTQIVICSYFNTTYNETFNTCTLSLFRRKRAPTEARQYTRWCANLEPTEQFIVKIFDEDISTPRTKQITAVNIQSVRANDENIVVRGVLVPPHTAITVKETSNANDYRRFLSFTKSNLVTNDLVISPPASNKLSTIAQGNLNIKNHKVKYVSPQNLERDDSPPASPQFVSRSDFGMVHQFAPITPVAFARKPTLTPLVPQKDLFDKFVTTKQKPTRTSPMVNNVVLPLRTYNFDTLTSFEYAISPQHTTLNNDFPTESNNELNKKSNEGDKNSLEKDIDAYGNMFYPDEDSESIMTKKTPKAMKNKVYNENNNDLKESDSREYQETDLDDSAESINTNASVDKDTESNNRTDTCSPSSTAITPVSKFLSVDMNYRRRLPCNVLQKRAFDLNVHHKLHEIVAQLKKWAEKSHVAKWTDITNGNYTYMENPIYMMIVDDLSKGQALSAKETVLIVAGIQGKDHHAVAAAMYLLYQLIERSESHAELLTKYRFWIIPVFNPDGYDYAMTFPKRREWTKNLRQTWNTYKDDDCVSCEEYGISCTIQSCYGVNLDRNFEYQWIPTEELRTEHPCGSLYAGPRQLSEVETQALTQYLHEQKTSLFMFIAYKEGDVLGVMYPYSHTKKKRPLDYTNSGRRSAVLAYIERDLYPIVDCYRLMMMIPPRWPSTVPNIVTTLYTLLALYAGGIDDWVDGHLGIDNTFTIMLFRATDSRDSSILMERVVREAYAATHTLLLYKPEPLSPPLVNIKKTQSNTIRPTRNNVILVTAVLLLGYG